MQTVAKSFIGALNFATLPYRNVFLEVCGLTKLRLILLNSICISFECSTFLLVEEIINTHGNM